MIAGDGLGENIRGIMNHTGLGSVEFDANELAAIRSSKGSQT